MTLKDRLQRVEENISLAAEKSGRKRSDITLVGVTKTVPVEKIAEAFHLGLKHFGENRTAELVKKQQAIPQASWHMIGRLQTNKVKDIVKPVALLHSLDRWDLALEVNKRAEQMQIIVPCLVQVNMAGEKQKGGLAPEEVGFFLERADKLLNIGTKGLMMIAPLEEEVHKNQEIFNKMKILFDNIDQMHYNNVTMEFLSMGMSGDYELAIAEGANMVRIGTAIFAD